jgi:hypothetical protein
MSLNIKIIIIIIIIIIIPKPNIFTEGHTQDSFRFATLVSVIFSLKKMFFASFFYCI